MLLGAAFISAGSCSISSKATSSRSSGASRSAIMILARLDIGLPLLFFWQCSSQGACAVLSHIFLSSRASLASPFWVYQVAVSGCSWIAAHISSKLAPSRRCAAPMRKALPLRELSRPGLAGGELAAAGCLVHSSATRSRALRSRRATSSGEVAQRLPVTVSIGRAEVGLDCRRVLVAVGCRSTLHLFPHCSARCRMACARQRLIGFASEDDLSPVSDGDTSV